MRILLPIEGYMGAIIQALALYNELIKNLSTKSHPKEMPCLLF